MFFSKYDIYPERTNYLYDEIEKIDLNRVSNTYKECYTNLYDPCHGHRVPHDDNSDLIGEQVDLDEAVKNINRKLVIFKYLQQLFSILFIILNIRCKYLVYCLIYLNICSKYIVYCSKYANILFCR